MLEHTWDRRLALLSFLIRRHRWWEFGKSETDGEALPSLAPSQRRRDCSFFQSSLQGHGVCTRKGRIQTARLSSAQQATKTEFHDTEHKRSVLAGNMKVGRGESG